MWRSQTISKLKEEKAMKNPSKENPARKERLTDCGNKNRIEETN